jgi:hypothetical protein
VKSRAGRRFVKDLAHLDTQRDQLRARRLDIRDGQVEVVN